MRGLKIAAWVLMLGAIITPASAQPVKVQYNYHDETYTGWLEYLDYRSAENQFESGVGFGFTRELTDYPAEASDSGSFHINAQEVAFLFGKDWIGVNAKFKYNQDLFTSYTFRIEQVGLRMVGDKPLLYFNLRD